jgi:Ca2+-binding RTX toxin-like protein
MVEKTRENLGNGSDTYTAYLNMMEMRGGNGDDNITLYGFYNSLFGENGADTLTLTGPDILLDGGRGDDRLISNSGYYGNADLTGGQGKDTFSVNNVGDLIVTNNSGSTTEVVSQGDIIFANIDQITDYQSGELLMVGTTSNAGSVIGLDNYAAGHQHLELSDGQYGVIRGNLTGEYSFAVDSGGSDLLVVYDRADGYDDGFYQGAVALLDYTGSVLIG